MGLLVITMIAPTTVAESRGARWLVLLVPALLAAVSARVLFETIDPTGVRRGHRAHVGPAVIAAIAATVFLTGAALIVGVPLSVTTAAITAVLGAAALIGAGVVRDLEIRVRLALRRVFFVGSEIGRGDLAHELRRRSDARLVGSVTLGPGSNVERLTERIHATRPTVLVIDQQAARDPMLVEAAAAFNLAGLHVRDLVSYYEAEFKKVPLAELSPTWFLFHIAQVHHRPLSYALRRTVEMLVALLTLVLAAPVLIAAAVAVKLSSPGPVLYRQRRVGKGGSPFTLLKLRTMTVAEEEALWAPAQAHRVTSVGRWLRRFRIDEVPQLLNVIRSDLALIGPRPEQVPIVERLEREIPFYGARHCIRPGLTGWAQVNLGYSGSVDGSIAKLQRDLYYIKHSSLRLDLLILWKTLETVISGCG